jgi:hypothetical protein
MGSFPLFLLARLAHMSFCNRPGKVFGGQKWIFSRAKEPEGVKDEAGTAALIG